MNYFSDLYSGPIWKTTPMPSGMFPRISEELGVQLAKPYVSREVLEALNQMNPYKAPRPYSFHAFFLEKYWNLAGSSMCEMVLGVLHGQHRPEGVNNTFITLVPKVDHPQLVSHFRLISLCNVVYKLITKCIVQRLKAVLPHVISPVQASFIPGHQIGGQHYYYARGPSINAVENWSQGVHGY